MLALVMTLSLCNVTSFAAGDYTNLTYAHFEIGTYSVNTKPGSAVEIPLSIVGVADDEYVGGFKATITLGDGLEWYDSDDKCVKWDETNMSSFGSKFINRETNLITAVDFGAAAEETTSFNGSGLVGYILCRVTNNCTENASNATIALSNISISGEHADISLNSTDENNSNSNEDKNAVVYENSDKTLSNTPVTPTVDTQGTTETTDPSSGENGEGGQGENPSTDPSSGENGEGGQPGTTDPGNTENQGDGNYRIVAEADKSTAVVDDTVTVKVVVYGGNYTGATVKLNYDSDKLTLESAPDSGWDELDNGDYFYCNATEEGFSNGTVIGTFKFTVNALTEADSTVVDLYDTYISKTYEDGFDKEHETLAADVDARISIAQGDISGITLPENNTFTYDGTDKASKEVTADGATVTYSDSEYGTYTANVPKHKDADTYTIYYKVSKSGYSTVKGSYPMVINRRDVTITVPAGQGKIYGDTTPENLTYTVDTPENGDEFNAAIARETGDNAGTYAITVTPTEGENPNYTVISNEGGTFTISQATLSDDITVKTAGSADYDGTPHAAVIAPSASELPGGVTIQYKVGEEEWTTEVPSFTDAGTYTIQWKTVSNNYVEKGSSVVFTITPIDLTGVVVKAAADTTYDGEEHPAIDSTSIEKPDDATIKYSTDNENWDTTIPTFKDAGTHTVYYKVSQTNHNDATGEVEFTITPATITGITVNAAADTTYDGKEHAAIDSANIEKPGAATIQYSTDNENWDTTIPTFKDAGTHTVYYKVSQTNYSDATGKVEFTITPAEVTITVNNYKITRWDTCPIPTGTVTGLDASLIEDLEYISDGDGTKEGSFDIVATWTESKNYTVTMNKGTLTVNKPTYDVEVNEYVPGKYSIVLVYTDSERITFSYDGAGMYDVSDAGYTYDNNEYNKVYAVVVKGTKDDEDFDAQALIDKVDADMTDPVGDPLTYDYDVNSSGSVGLNDVVAVVFVYAGNDTYMNNYKDIVLKSDVNGDKVVDSADFAAVRAQLK
jgi:hypothetical protein